MPTKNVYARASTCNVNDNNQFLSSLETERSTTTATATTSKSEEKKNETQQCIIASHLEHYTSSHTLYSRHIFLKRFFRSLFVGHFIVKIPFLWTFFPFVHHFFHSWMVLSSNDSNSDTWKCNFLAGRNALCVAQVRFIPSLLLLVFFSFQCHTHAFWLDRSCVAFSFVISGRLTHEITSKGSVMSF